MKKRFSFEKIPAIITGVLILLFAGLLAIYGLKGTYSRYSQDDYCYGYKVHQFGFLDMQIHSYFNTNEFNSDRYSLTIAHSVVELTGGPKIVPLLPSLEMIAWLAALSFAIWELLRIVAYKPNYLSTVLSAISIIFFTLYMTPGQYQDSFLALRHANVFHTRRTGNLSLWPIGRICQVIKIKSSSIDRTGAHLLSGNRLFRNNRSMAVRLLEFDPDSVIDFPEETFAGEECNSACYCNDGGSSNFIGNHGCLSGKL